MKRLIIAPHGDDDILGAGGTIAKYAARGDSIIVCNVTVGKPPVFTDAQAQATLAELEPARRLLGIERTVFLGFPAAMLDQTAQYQINDALSDLIIRESPDVVYIPHFADVNEDHRIVAEACMVALRPRGARSVKQIYAYEILSSTEWNAPNPGMAFTPDAWEDVSYYLAVKLQAMALLTTQVKTAPDPRSLEAIRALAVLRGSTVMRRAAEAFETVRLIND